MWFSVLYLKVCTVFQTGDTSQANLTYKNEKILGLAVLTKVEWRALGVDTRDKRPQQTHEFFRFSSWKSIGTVETDNPKNGIVNSRFGWKLCMLLFSYSECWLHNFVMCARRQFPFIFTQSLDADLNLCVVYCIVMWRKLCSRFCLAPLLGIFLACTVSCIPSKKCTWDLYNWPANKKLLKLCWCWLASIVKEYNLNQYKYNIYTYYIYIAEFI